MLLCVVLTCLLSGGTNFLSSSFLSQSLQTDIGIKID